MGCPRMTTSLQSDDENFISNSSVQFGLPSQQNWLCWRNTPDSQDGVVCYEYPLYSDAHITGEYREGLGPYNFLNTVPMTIGSGMVNAPIILRTSIHLPNLPPDMSKKNEDFYHGGTLPDELAALTSVALGIRVLAGGISREFGISNDPLGQPREGWSEPKPTIPTRYHQQVLPSVAGTHSMDTLDILKTIPHIEPSRYVQLIRACRSYQQALWTADSDPNIAWLLLVSAIETAANDVYTTDAEPETLLRTFKPCLANYLESIGGSEHVARVAGYIAQTLSSTKKFIDFTIRFRPDEPSERPSSKLHRVDWSESGMKKVLRKVYDYRSRSLHAGIPFPEPMFRPPFQQGIDKTAPFEVPIMGLATYSRGGTWTPQDAPINLHCFHYIARGALLNWWKNILAASHTLDNG